MGKQGVMKEIRLDIHSEMTMNMINYLLIEENYIYVGNEKEIWLENLSHPTVQLIYINQRSIFNEMQATQLMKQIDRVRQRVRTRYLLWRLNVVILNVDSSSISHLEPVKHYVKVFHINQINDFKHNEELNQFYPNLKKAKLDYPMDELIYQMQQATKAKALNVRKTLEFQKKSYLMMGFISLLILIFIWIQLQPYKNLVTAIEFGAKYNPLIVAGEYWRFLTPAFIHMNFLHLLFNVVFIYQFGKMIEHLFGWWRSLLIMVGAAILGNLFSFAFVENVSLGASTIAYGLLGALLFLGIENRKMFMHLVKGLIFPILSFSVFWAIIDPSIDFYGHLGGFLGGFLIATVVGLPSGQHYMVRTFLSIATYLLLSVGLLTRGTYLTEQTDYSAYNRAIVLFYIQTGQLEEANRFCSKIDVDFSNLFTP